MPTLAGQKVPTAQNIEVPRLAKHDKEEKYSVLAKSAQIIEVPITRGFTVVANSFMVAIMNQIATLFNVLRYYLWLLYQISLTLVKLELTNLLYESQKQ